MAKEKVLRDGKVGNQGTLLKDHADSVPDCIGRVLQ